LGLRVAIVVCDHVLGQENEGLQEFVFHFFLFLSSCNHVCCQKQLHILLAL